MSVPTHDLLAAAALRVNALGNPDLEGFQATDGQQLEIMYSERPLTAEMFNSSIFAMSDIIAALNWAQGKLAEQIAFSDKRTQLSYLRSTTAALASGDVLPSLDNASVSIIGNFGACVDSEDPTKQLTRKSVAFVQNILSSSNNFLVELYHYALSSGRIIHTRDNAVLECWVYDYEDRLNDFILNENIVLADALCEAIICGACAYLMRDDEFSAQSKQWADYFQSTLAQYPPAIMEEQAA